MARVLSQLATAPLAVFGSTSAMAHELTAADRLLRTPLPLSRRVGFVHLRGGAGASTTAAYVASVLARRRSGMVIGVNASTGPDSILSHAGLPVTAEHRPSDRRARAQSALDARDGLPITRSGLYSMDVPALAATKGAASPAEWSDNLEPITRFFDVVSTDWGVRSWQAELGQVAALSHVVCLVARADRSSAEEAASMVPALLGQEDGPRVVLALVDVGGTADRGAGLLRVSADIPVLDIPFDPASGSSRAIPSSALRARTRIAYTRLATAIISEALLPLERGRS